MCKLFGVFKFISMLLLWSSTPAAFPLWCVLPTCALTQVELRSCCCRRAICGSGERETSAKCLLYGPAASLFLLLFFCVSAASPLIALRHVPCLIQRAVLAHWAGDEAYLLKLPPYRPSVRRDGWWATTTWSEACLGIRLSPSARPRTAGARGERVTVQNKEFNLVRMQMTHQLQPHCPFFTSCSHIISVCRSGSNVLHKASEK